jgi:hypothetical protein
MKSTAKILKIKISLKGLASEVGKKLNHGLQNGNHSKNTEIEVYLFEIA